MKILERLKAVLAKLQADVDKLGDAATDEQTEKLKGLKADITELEAISAAKPKTDEADGKKKPMVKTTPADDFDAEKFMTDLKKTVKDTVDDAVKEKGFTDKNIAVLKGGVSKAEVEKFNDIGKESEEDQAKTRFGKLLAVHVMHKFNPYGASYFIENISDEKLKDSLEKSLLSTVFDAGGSTVREDMAEEIIDLLRPASVVRRAGPRMVTIPRGNFGMDKLTAGATATWGEEGTNTNASQQKTGQIKLVAHKLTVIIPVTNELLRYTSGKAMQLAQNDALRIMGTTEDVAFLRGSGTLSQPKGMRNHALAGNVFATAGATAANVESDVNIMITNLEGKDIGMVKPAWFGVPRSRGNIGALREAAGGNRVFPEMRGSTPLLEGHPWWSTNNIPSNLGGGSNETEILLADMEDQLIANVDEITLAVVDGAAYLDSTGTLLSGFSRNETVIRMVLHVDFATLHSESISVMTGVTY